MRIAIGLASIVLIGLIDLALAQSNPGFTSRTPLTAPNLDTAFQNKQDYPGSGGQSITLTCDGSTDNTAAFQAAANSAISGTGLLNVVSSNSANTCKFSSLTTLVPASASQSGFSQLTINLDAGVKINFNGSAGWVKFDGTTGTGSWIYPTIHFNGARIWPFASGSAYAIAFVSANLPMVDHADFAYNQSSFFSNGISLDSVVQPILEYNQMSLSGGSYGIRFLDATGPSNFARIAENDIAATSVAAIALDSSAFIGNTNRFIHNYIELNTGVGMIIKGADSWVINNYFHDYTSTGAFELQLTGSNPIVDGNTFDTTGVSTGNIQIASSNGLIFNSNFVSSPPTSNNALVATAGSTHNYVKGLGIVQSGWNSPPYTDAGSGNVWQDLKTNNNTFFAATAYPVNNGGTGSNLSATGGTSQVLQQTSSGANVTVGQLAASNLSNGVTGTGPVLLMTSPTIITPVLSNTADQLMLIGAGGVNSHYNAIGLNNTLTGGSMIGLAGGGSGDNSLYLLTPSGNSVVFRLGGTNVGQLSASGNFQVTGVASAVTATFGNSTSTTTTSTSTGPVLINNGGLAVNGPIAASLNVAATTSAVCINTSTGLLTYDGAIGTCNTSDARLKNIEGPIAGALDKILKIDGIYFNYKNPASAYDQGRKIGVTAQNVQAVFPELVAADSNGIMSVDYQKLTAPIIEAMRELKAENDNLKACQESWKCRLFGLR